MKENYDDTLLLQLKEGKNSTYREIVDRFKGKIYSIAYSVTGNTADAQDIAQEVFITMYTQADRLRAGQTLAGWLCKTALNKAIDVKRKTDRQRKRNEKLHAELQNSSNEDQSANPGNSGIMNAVREVFDRLTKNQKRVYVLRDIQNFTTREIAEILNCTQITVRVHLANARRRIKDHIIKNYPEFAEDYRK